MYASEHDAISVHNNSYAYFILFFIVMIVMIVEA